MKNLNIAYACILVGMVGVFMLTIPYFDASSSSWREFRLNNASIRRFNSVVINIDEKSRQIDARSEALAQCYEEVKKNKSRYRSELHQKNSPASKDFYSCLRIAYDGFRDNSSIGVVSDRDFADLVAFFRDAEAKKIE